MAAEGRLVVTGGVIGWDHHGHLPEDFVAQVRQTLSNISAILAEGGAGPNIWFASPGMSSTWKNICRT